VLVCKVALYVLSPEVGCEVGAEVTRIVASTVDETRPQESKDEHTNQVHAGRRDDTTVVAETAPVVEDGHVKPRIVRAVSSGPDDRPELTALEVKSERR
jgi:hypothetical protein